MTDASVCMFVWLLVWRTGMLGMGGSAVLFSSFFFYFLTFFFLFMRLASMYKR